MDGKKADIKRIAGIIFLFLAALMFFVGVGVLGKQLYQDYKNTKNLSEVDSLLENNPNEKADVEIEPDEPVEDIESVKAEKYRQLHEQNPDFIGWISIEGTLLDYPVMYTPDRSEYYLRRDFDGNYSVFGVPFIDEECTLSETDRSENLTIYGHHVKTGTMFGCLQNYTDEKYFKEHPYIQFDTIYDSGTYEVFSAFTIDVGTDDFGYYLYNDMDEKTYEEFVNEAISRSFVQAGIVPEYGQEIITLSTCEYSHTNGRMVVMAKKVE